MSEVLYYRPFPVHCIEVVSIPTLEARWYPFGLTLEKAMRWYWKAKEWTSSYNATTSEPAPFTRMASYSTTLGRDALAGGGSMTSESELVCGVPWDDDGVGETSGSFTLFKASGSDPDAPGWQPPIYKIGSTYYPRFVWSVSDTSDASIALASGSWSSEVGQAGSLVSSSGLAVDGETAPLYGWEVGNSSPDVALGSASATLTLATEWSYAA